MIPLQPNTLFLILLLTGLLAVTQVAGAACLDCHRDMQQGFNSAHERLAKNCVRCHGGDPGATTAARAHHGLIAFPGDMDSARRACADCHADKVDGVSHSLMHTGAGMITITRQVFGEAPDRPGHNDLAHLTHSPADSLLRKQCASCHLGQEKTVHVLNATTDRGGGCLACHINAQTPGKHPALTARVSDARCFGCHSRSGRISLNYTGLAETDSVSADTRQLEDGRPVEPRPADRHHAAGMACIDCHTERDLMGTATAVPAANQQQAVDIRCEDCHRITRTISPERWPAAYRALRARIPYPVEKDSRIPVTTNGTPLWHIELQGDRAWLHPKLGGERLLIPPFRDRDHPLVQPHARLACSACHSQWAPQCHGCHLDYDAADRQYDHADGNITAGRWNSRRDGIRNDLPPLGVSAGNQVVPVIPGMIMTLTHPDWSAPRFVRRFSALEPHTSGPARGCASCHRSSTALGLGEGRLQVDGQLHFQAVQPLLDDGLPADAWTGLEATSKAPATAPVRPFSRKEMERILAVPVQPGDSPGHTR